VLAHLMLSTGKSLASVFTMVKERRPRASPNAGVWAPHRWGRPAAMLAHWGWPAALLALAVDKRPAAALPPMLKCAVGVWQPVDSASHAC
jgi:hypothetical protein